MHGVCASKVPCRSPLCPPSACSQQETALRTRQHSTITAGNLTLGSETSTPQLNLFYTESRNQYGAYATRQLARNLCGPQELGRGCKEVLELLLCRAAVWVLHVVWPRRGLWAGAALGLKPFLVWLVAPFPPLHSSAFCQPRSARRGIYTISYGSLQGWQLLALTVHSLTAAFGSSGCKGGRAEPRWGWVPLCESP